jgi:hypothetical protein
LENLAVLNDGIQETIANFCETSNKFSYKNWQPKSTIHFHVDKAFYFLFLWFFISAKFSAF